MSPPKSSNNLNSNHHSELMIVNESAGECRIAILQDGHLDELYEERAATATSVGNIYKGRVTNVEPAIQAAFVDYGRGQSGFLHISDLHPRYFPRGGQAERVGRKTPRRDRPLMQEALHRGDEILVQVLKEGIGTKGPTLTSYLSIPGRLIVCMPYLDRVGVTRKVEDEELRREARKTLDQLDLPEGFGFILRTAGIGRPKAELKRDVAYLMRLWKVMDHRIKRVGAPCELYRESDLLIRTIRDVVRPSIGAIVVDSDSAHRRASEFLSVVSPRSTIKVVRYRGAAPIFHAFDVERQIDLIHSHEVPLPSGGSLVIEQTEALVAIDVNSGRSRDSRDSEANALQTNMEAVDEICRQLRLRDLGGLIINDLIDMRAHRNRRKVEDRMNENLRRDRAKTTALPISEFGLIELTRQRMRPSLRKTHFIACPHCNGNGELKSPSSVGSDAVRHVRFLSQYDRVKKVEMVVSPRVASVLLSAMRRELVRIEEDTAKRLEVRVSEAVADDRVDFYAYDNRGADVDVTQLPTLRPPTLEELEERDRNFREKAATEPIRPESPLDEADRHRGRRRRRRRGGPADADTIALTSTYHGVEDIDEIDEQSPVNEAEELAATTPESAPPPESGERRSRRRGRRGGRRHRRDGAELAAPPVASTTSSNHSVESAPGQAAPSAESSTSPDPTAPISPEPIRIHVLAKDLGVSSKELLERVKQTSSIDVKSHMSSVSADDARTIRSWFVDDLAHESAATNEQQTQVFAAAADRSQPQRRGPAQPTGQATQGERRGRRRRRRRGSGRSTTTDQHPSPVITDGHSFERNGQPASPPHRVERPEPPHPQASGGEQPRRKRRRGRRRRDAADQSQPHTTQAASPINGSPQRPLSSAPIASPSASATTSLAPVVSTTSAIAAAGKKRRTLYRTHSRVSSSAREQSHRELAE